MLKTSAKIKRPLWVIGLNVALALTVGTSQAVADTPIENQTQLELIGSSPESLGENYVVTKSFIVGDATGSTYVTGTFTGTFDGGGFTISGLTKPLFDTIDGSESGPDTTISDLTLEAAADGVNGQGILANESWGGTVNVHVDGDVTATFSVGGLVGSNYGTITNSSAVGTVTGIDSVGGLVGYNEGTITNSSAAVTVTGTFSVDGDGIPDGGFEVGGLVGSNYGTITDSSALGSVSGASSVGGLVGYNEYPISNSYASGSASGNYSIGGLVGENYGPIANSYATGDVVASGAEAGGLVGYHAGHISNSYSAGNVDGPYSAGGLVGYNYNLISNSYATGSASGTFSIGGLVGDNYGTIDNSYATGSVSGTEVDGLIVDVGGFIGFDDGLIIGESDASGSVNGIPSGMDPFTDIYLLAILNTGSVSFALDPGFNGGRPYLISNRPIDEVVVEDDLRIDIDFNFLPTQVLTALNKSVGFEAAKSDLNKLDLAFLDQVKGEKSAPIIGAKLFANQSLTTSLSIGSLLQLEINFAGNKALQMWVKSLDGQYVLVGDVTFDKDGNAVLPGIEFKKSGSYEFIFVNSDKKDLAQPELVNKVSGLTVYVNQ